MGDRCARPAPARTAPAMKIGLSLGVLRPSAWEEVTVRPTGSGTSRCGCPSTWSSRCSRRAVRSPGRTTRPSRRTCPSSTSSPIWGSWPARTEQIHFGTQVYNIGLRHPFTVARSVATLDVLSQGRVEFGIGASWLEAEWDAVGLDFASPGPPGGRGHRGVPAPVERGGDRAPRGVLRLRPGHVRAQTRPGALAQPAHRRRRSRRPPAGRAARRRVDPHEPHRRTDPRACRAPGPGACRGRQEPGRWRSPSGPVDWHSTN